MNIFRCRIESGTFIGARHLSETEIPARATHPRESIPPRLLTTVGVSQFVSV